MTMAPIGTATAAAHANGAINWLYSLNQHLRNSVSITLDGCISEYAASLFVFKSANANECSGQKPKPSRYASAAYPAELWEDFELLIDVLVAAFASPK